MGALNEWNPELNGGVNLGCTELATVGEEEEEYISIQDAVRVLLKDLREDINRDGLRRTPFRVAKAFKEGTRGYKEKVKDTVKGALFNVRGFNTEDHVGASSSGLVIIRDLDLFSYCESCLLPFHIGCHVGYVPSDGRVLGLSKFSRAAAVFAKRLQEPQRLADELCQSLQDEVKPKGVAVVLCCSHIHFPDHRPSDITVSSASFAFRQSAPWVDLLAVLRLKPSIFQNDRGRNPWCPYVEKKSCVSAAAVDAVTSIITSLGEDVPLRKELKGTPNRYLTWLGYFKNRTSRPNGGVCIVGDDAGEVRAETCLPFWSLCEHHLLPFHGVVHVGYCLCRTVERSATQSVIKECSFRVQVQEQLTHQIAEALRVLLGSDVVVVVDAVHFCMISRGVEKPASTTTTVSAFGRFSTDPSMRLHFMEMIPRVS